MTPARASLSTRRFIRGSGARYQPSVRIFRLLAWLGGSGTAWYRLIGYRRYRANPDSSGTGRVLVFVHELVFRVDYHQ